jgi:hypothetical protein
MTTIMLGGVEVSGSFAVFLQNTRVTFPPHAMCLTLIGNNYNNEHA